MSVAVNALERFTSKPEHRQTALKLNDHAGREQVPRKATREPGTKTAYFSHISY